MSGIIMNSYDKYSKGEPIELEIQIKKYHKYWKKQYGEEHLSKMRKDVEKFMIDEIRDKKIDEVLQDRN